MLTGVKDLDMIILNKLEDKDLVNISKVNKYLNKLYNDQMFWLNRILFKFKLPIEVMNKYKKDRRWSEYYIKDLRKINSNNSNIYLYNGAENGRLDHIIISMKMGSNINDNNCVIVPASRNGHTDIVKYLTEAGANIHDHEDGAMRMACQNGHIDTVKYLVEVGSNIHADDDIALSLASLHGHINTVRYLVEAGADIHVYDNEAIRWAYDNKHMNVVDYLISVGAPDPRTV